MNKTTPICTVASLLGLDLVAAPNGGPGPVAASADSAEGLRGRLPGREAERFGMSPAVVPGQDLAEVPGRHATVRRQIWQRVTGSWVTVTGKRRELELLITSHEQCVN
jgi:hypothetical protein